MAAALTRSPYWAGETTPSGKSARVRRPQAGQSWTAARCSVTISGFCGRSNTCRVSSSTFESAGSRLAMLADLGRMLDDRVGSGDLAQRVAAMAFLASARLARARAQALQNPRLLLQPVARRRLGAVGAVQIQTSPKLGVLGPKRLDLASERVDQLHDFGRKNHSTLESEVRAPVPKNRNADIDSPPGVAFRTHPGLAVTRWRNGGAIPCMSAWAASGTASRSCRIARRSDAARAAAHRPAT